MTKFNRRFLLRPPPVECNQALRVHLHLSSQTPEHNSAASVSTQSSQQVLPSIPNIRVQSHNLTTKSTLTAACLQQCPAVPPNVCPHYPAYLCSVCVAYSRVSAFSQHV